MKIRNATFRILQQNVFIVLFFQTEDDPFNPDFVEVDRVLDEATHTDPTTGETVRHYLVKWRSLQYEDSTWELEEDVDPEKIAQFTRFNKVPPKDQWKVRSVLSAFYKIERYRSIGFINSPFRSRYV